jgi:hypothetical protein
MKVAYIDCVAGASGDMLLGALLDLGLPLSYLEKTIKKIHLPFRLEVEQTMRGSIGAIRVKVNVEEKGVVRTWPSIEEIIRKSRLEKEIKESALKALLLLAQAEANIHRVNIDQVHFHEIGALDTLVDVVGVISGFHYFQVKEIFCSLVPTGVGMVKTEHGLLPLPPPATLEILKGVPTYSLNIQAELTTPTGASLLKTLCSQFGKFPLMKIEKTGYGAGSRDLEIPNVLRIILGEKISPESDVVLIETNLDDISPEIIGYLKGLLFEAGAVDVWTTPIQMKKERPGVALSAIVPLPFKERVIEKIFEESTTLGVRITPLERVVLSREVIEVETSYGKGKVKIAWREGKIISVSAEYEDCVKLAKKAGVPLKKVKMELERKALSHLNKLTPKQT